jgi:CRISPR-associated protein Csx10
MNSETKSQVKDSSFVLPSPFTIRLEMKSDWHVGTGAGRPGSIDKLIARDADGFPFVPAKTLNGIWRDAMETLTLGLDDGNERRWSTFVELIFGNQPALPGADPSRKPSSSILKIQPARLHEKLRDRISSFEPPEAGKDAESKERRRLGKIQKEQYLSALTFIKPGVAIDRVSGTAIPDFLRFEEMGRAGTVLYAACHLSLERLNSESKSLVSALLLLSAKFIERIGGKRRRGAGLCELKLVGCEESQIAAAIEILKEKREEIEKSSQPSNADHSSSESDDSQRSIVRIDDSRADSKNKSENGSTGGWQILEFALRLQTPVSIVTATLGNVSESLDYVPGTHLLPHITRVLRNKLGAKIFQAVAYGDLQVLPATIEINGERGLPVPKAIYYDKLSGGFDKQKDGDRTVYNLFKERDGIETGEQKKSSRSGYVQALDTVSAGANKLPSYKNARKTLLMHNTVEDAVQRPTENVGGVYSREAIAAGTTLRGEIRLRTRLEEELQAKGADWWKDLDGAVRLGTSRKDDYGLAELSVSAPKGFSSSSELNGSRLVVYLESDCLLRNGHLRQTNLATDLASEIARKDNLGFPLKPIQTTAQETTSLVMTRRIESWHDGWGFPRPTLIGMEAGSCVVFEIENFDLLTEEERTALEENLQTVEAAGIGERRGEGYGHLRINPSLLTHPINAWAVADKPSEAKPPVDNMTLPFAEHEEKLAKLIEETAWREELKVAVLKIADDSKLRERIFGFDVDHEKPPMSQIGGLRSAVSRLQTRNDSALVINWLEHLQDTPNRRDKWAKTREAANAKLERLKRLFDEPQNVWEWLQGGFNEPPTLVRSNAELQRVLWAQAVRSLFDACARAHKRELEKKGSN